MGNACPSFELLSAYRDGETTAAETAVVARHLPGCAACRATVSGFEQLAADVFAAPAITCEVARPLISAQIDGEASAPELAIVAQHLAGCVACEETRAAWTGVERLIASLPEAFPSPAADAQIRALAHRGRAGRPNFGRAFASLAVATATIALAVYSSIGGGLVRAPQLGAAPQGAQAIVASAAQQVYNPLSGLLYVLEPAPKAAVVVRDAGRQRDVKTIFLGGAPSFMAINATAKALYVVDPVARTYTSINTDTNEVTDTVPLAVTGTPTSIAVDAQTGKLVVATEPAKTSTAATPAASARPEISVIDPASKTLEIVRQVDVTPTRIVVDPIRGRLFLLGAGGTSVLDARTYDRVDTISGAVAIAAGPQRTAVLSERGGQSVLSFYQAAGSASFAGTPVGLFALVDGGFALLVEDASGGRIALANADGTARGPALVVPAGVRGFTFDAGSGRFFAASGDVVAAVSQGALVTVAPTSTPAVAAVPSPIPTASVTTPSATPTTSAPASNTPGAPASATPLVTLPSPSPAPTLFPGAVLSAGLFRYELGANYTITALVAGDDGRLWASASDGAIRSIDPLTGRVSVATQLGSVRVVRLAFGSGWLFALTDQGRLYVIRLSDGALSGTDVPFGRTVTAMSVAPSGQLWLAASDYSGLLGFDPRTAQFAVVFLDPGTTPSALSVDGAGRVWFADATRHTLGSYEPSLARVTYRALPTTDRVVALLADGHSNIWLGTDHGAVLRAAPDVIESVTTVGRSVLALVPGRDSVVMLVDAGPSTLVGTPGGTVTVASGTVRAVAVDGSGHPWLADGQRAVLYIVGTP